jgi:hypothetical protein
MRTGFSYIERAFDLGSRSEILNPQRQSSSILVSIVDKPLRCTLRFSYGLTCTTIIAIIGTYFNFFGFFKSFLDSNKNQLNNCNKGLNRDFPYAGAVILSIGIHILWQIETESWIFPLSDEELEPFEKAHLRECPSNSYFKVQPHSWARLIAIATFIVNLVPAFLFACSPNSFKKL